MAKAVNVEAKARSLSVQTSTYISWGQTPDEAIQSAINDIFPTGSDDFKASLFATICEGGSLAESDIAKAVSKSL